MLCVQAMMFIVQLGSNIQLHSCDSDYLTAESVSAPSAASDKDFFHSETDDRDSRSVSPCHLRPKVSIAVSVC